MNKSIGRITAILFRRNQIYLNSALQSYNLTSAELPVIKFLYEKEGSSQEEISRELAIDKSATTRVIKKLIAKGYVEKKQSQSDGRAYELYTTDKSKNHIDEFMKIFIYWTNYLTEGIDQTDLEITYKTLNKIIEKVLSSDLKKLGKEASKNNE